MRVKNLFFSLGGLVLTTILSSTDASAHEYCGENRAVQRELRALAAAEAAAAAGLALVAAESSSDEEVVSESSRSSSPGSESSEYEDWCSLID